MDKKQTEILEELLYKILTLDAKQRQVIADYIDQFGIEQMLKKYFRLYLNEEISRRLKALKEITCSIESQSDNHSFIESVSILTGIPKIKLLQFYKQHPLNNIFNGNSCITMTVRQRERLDIVKMFVFVYSSESEENK